MLQQLLLLAQIRETGYCYRRNILPDIKGEAGNRGGISAAWPRNGGESFEVVQVPRCIQVMFHCPFWSSQLLPPPPLFLLHPRPKVMNYEMQISPFFASGGGAGFRFLLPPFQIRTRAQVVASSAPPRLKCRARACFTSQSGTLKCPSPSPRHSLSPAPSLFANLAVLRGISWQRHLATLLPEFLQTPPSPA